MNMMKSSSGYARTLCVPEESRHRSPRADGAPGVAFLGDAFSFCLALAKISSSYLISSQVSVAMVSVARCAA
jgi:hypothetical protein